jgi:hypothetical protein
MINCSKAYHAALLLAAIACILACASLAHAQMALNIGQSQQKFTVLPERGGLNLANALFVDLDHDGKDDLLVSGSASYGGDNIGSFYLLLAPRIRPENSPFDLAKQKPDRVYKAARAGDFSTYLLMAKGDWDGDGRQDLALGGSGAGSLKEGSIFIIRGRDNLTTGTSQLLRPDTVDVCLLGQAAEVMFGCSMASADVNGDGTDDLLVSDKYNLYVLFGGTPFLSRLPAGSYSWRLPREGQVECRSNRPIDGRSGPPGPVGVWSGGLAGSRQFRPGKACLCRRVRKCRASARARR